jgi:5-methylcytosine-specific restriction endonuclease McrA
MLSKLTRLRAGGMDEYVYATEGRVIPGDTVHHIIPLSEDVGKAFDEANLICLSRYTHDVVVKREYGASIARKKKLQATMQAIVRRRMARGDD